MYFAKFVQEENLLSPEEINRIINQHCGEVRHPRKDRHYEKDKIRQKIRKLKSKKHSKHRNVSSLNIK